MSRRVPQPSMLSTDHPQGDPRVEGSRRDLEAESLSPSLALDRSRGAAFEMKFLLDRALADQVRTWAGAHLLPDPHGDAALGNAYDVTTTYLDTKDLDIARRALGAGARKFRMRRYGTDMAVWLEHKLRRKDRVRKLRCVVSAGELAQLAELGTVTEWGGRWFHEQVLDRELIPACCIAYRRSAFFATTPEGPVRLTLDRDVRGVLHSGWDVPHVESGTPILPASVICEMKFRAALPTILKGLIAKLGLTAGGVSKYRQFMEAAGSVPKSSEPHA